MAKKLEQELMEEEEDALGDRYLTFQLDKEIYGIEIKNVIEIIGIQTITEVPELPDFMRGIINLRGKIIPVMDARLRFRKNFREYNDRTCIIIISILDRTMGLIVDSVSEVVSIPETEIFAPPEITQTGSRLIRGVGKVNNEATMLLDCETILNF